MSSNEAHAEPRFASTEVSGRGGRPLGSAAGQGRPHPLSTVLAAGVYGAAACCGLLPIAVWPVALAAGAGAALGAVLSAFRFAQRLRLSALFAMMLVAVLTAHGLSALLVGQTAVAARLGPADAVQWAFGLEVALSGVAVALFLRTATLRYRAFAALEVALVAAAGTGLVVAHRGGAINRPFEIADAILAEGGDPTAAFLFLGAVTVALLLLLLLAERRPGRGLFHLLFIALLFALLGDLLRVPDPPPSSLLSPADGHGRKGERKSKDKGRGHGASRPPEPNEELRFRDNYDNEGQTAPLAVVLLHNDYSPPAGMYYFRQAAFSQYNGRRLVQAARSQVDNDVASGYPVALTQLPPVPDAERERVTVETTVALLSEHARPFALESLQTLTPMENPDPGRFRRVYRATSQALTADLGDLLQRPVGDRNWQGEVWVHYLRVPQDSRYSELAQKIVSGLPEALRADPVAQALSISLWLGHEGTYSLRSGHADAEDPTADFLFGDRTGYCVHFAHAAVFLMRALGVPARVGAGYVVDEAARQGGSSILITGQNAHAWPEFYVDGVGWVIADVAPERALDPPPAPPDPDLQRLLGEMARGLRPLPTGETGALQPAVRALRDFVSAARMVLLFLVPLVLLLMYLVKIWRRQAPWLSAERHLSRLCYRAQLDQLSEVALLRAHGESREAFARRMATSMPAFMDMTRLHMAGAFGVPPSLPRLHYRELSRRFRTEFRRTVPWWRRFLSAVDPLSFLRVR